ncbi:MULTISPECIES: SpoIID/LytB domain-containing protein [Planktothrix]|jgi:SpoIID/LytB domain protein|uniref:SpoIID/LytB domain protein n=1 Tax=Planktothrix rubescens CCAP 1459/22 TaxID=329571 RepID=A0A6J7ZS90_PLARU|nr:MULTISPECIES: SpoIID/LytB domain-containing protein [Planktothrix]CAC5345562.1 SpoIID/LytB domain protein [Planktothrix rubescens NIVA-CYA 18]CAD5957069.1 Amidase enhancer [Planktothrix rubescens NIVA-CYA 18]CAH2573436.1 Amidase enhancer [Planktothrix rubescens]
MRTSKLLSRTSTQSAKFTVSSLIFFSLLVFSPKLTVAQEREPKDMNIPLKIGVVQHFGQKPTDQLILKAQPGDYLTLQFQTPQGNKQLQTESVLLKMGFEPLPEPEVEERVVLSTHRSYENAEEDAQKWRSLGLEVELAQPDRWQVWAKRSVYNTPLLRRWLIDSLQAQGHKLPRLKTQVLTQKRTPYWTAAGYRYNRNELQITSPQNVIQVSQKPNDPEPLVYGGSLRLQPDAYGTYTLVNNVPLETYLRGVVPHEIGAWPPAASIEAQAVLARTYALRNLQRFEADNYHLCANTDCQVYRGLTEVYSTTDQAIEVTKGLALTHNNNLTEAVYFSSSGGVTANYNDIWNGEPRPYLQGVIDAPNKIWDLSQQNLASEPNFRKFINLKTGFNETGELDFRWRGEATLEAIAEQLRSYLKRRNLPQANLKTVQKVEIVKRSPTGRVLKMIVTTDQGMLEIAKDEIQSAFLPPISTLFYIDPVYNPNKTLKGYVFVGGGFGHGVGMSQTGSYHLAKLGWSSEQILNFYFPGTQLQPLNPSMLSGN